MPGTANTGRCHDYDSQEQKEEEEFDEGDSDDQGEDKDPPWLTTKLNCVYFPSLVSSLPHPEEALSHSFSYFHIFSYPGAGIKAWLLSTNDDQSAQPVTAARQ